MRLDIGWLKSRTSLRSGGVQVMCAASWPEFMHHDAVADRYWSRLRDDWPAFQLVLVDETGEVAAASQAAPVRWDGTNEDLPDGWDAQFERSVADFEAGRAPEALGAISAAWPGIVAVKDSVRYARGDEPTAVKGEALMLRWRKRR